MAVMHINPLLVGFVHAHLLLMNVTNGHMVLTFPDALMFSFSVFLKF